MKRVKARYVCILEIDTDTVLESTILDGMDNVTFGERQTEHIRRFFSDEPDGSNVTVTQTYADLTVTEVEE